MSGQDTEASLPALTKRAWTVGRLARDLAKAVGDPVVDTRHILHSLVMEGDGVAAVVLGESGIDKDRIQAWLATTTVDDDLDRVVRVDPDTALSSVGVDLEAVRRRTDELFGKGSLGEVEVDPPVGEAAYDLYVNTKDEAIGLGHNYIGTEHLLLAFTAPTGSTAERHLRKLGLDASMLRGRVLQTVERFHVAIDDPRYRATMDRINSLKDDVDTLDAADRRRARPVLEELNNAVWQHWVVLYPNPSTTLFDAEFREPFLTGIASALDACLDRLSAEGISAGD